MTENKLNIAQCHIDTYAKRMDLLIKDIDREARYIREDIEKGKFYWLDAYAKKILEYQKEYEHYKKMREEMQDLLNFLIKEDAEEKIDE